MINRILADGKLAAMVAEKSTPKFNKRYDEAALALLPRKAPLQKRHKQGYRREYERS